MTSAITRAVTLLNGRRVGSDADGNRYYQSRRVFGGLRRRWAIFAKGGQEPNAAPPEWKMWLAGVSDAPPPPGVSAASASSSDFSARAVSRAARPRGAGDYEAWSPDLDEKSGGV